MGSDLQDNISAVKVFWTLCTTNSHQDMRLPSQQALFMHVGVSATVMEAMILDPEEQEWRRLGPPEKTSPTFPSEGTLCPSSDGRSGGRIVSRGSW